MAYNGREAIRRTLTNFISAPSFSGINQVFRSFPKIIQWEINSFPGQQYLSAAVIHIESEEETRLAIGGATNGIKRVDSQVAVWIAFHGLWGGLEEAMDEFDQLIENFKELLRSDHQFGDTSGTLVWQGAEPVIRATYSEPEVDDNGVIDIWAIVRFPVTQMIQA